MPAIDGVLYLHGFLSVPGRGKSLAFAGQCRELGLPCVAPDLNVETPEELISRVETAIASLPGPRWAVVGSSLGGFLAEALLSARASRLLLLNPVTRPWPLARERVGECRVADGRPLRVTLAFVNWLRDIAPRAPGAPDRTLVVLGTGDEVLDWREAERFYGAAARWLLPGVDHAITDISRYIALLMPFLGEGALPPGCLPPRRGAGP